MLVKLKQRSIDLGDHPSKEAIKRWSGEMSPEPETVEWIYSLEPGRVFFDVGANIGRFSIMAWDAGLQVVAIEPNLDQFVELCGTIAANELPIMAVNAAISNRTGIGSMGHGRSKYTLHDKRFGVPNVLVETIDTLAEMAMVYPDYIKIDVDGDEPKILNGARKSLEKVRSVLVEVDPHISGHKYIPEMMKARGFTFDPAQVERDKVKGGKYDGMANYIFNRG